MIKLNNTVVGIDQKTIFVKITITMMTMKSILLFFLCLVCQVANSQQVCDICRVLKNIRLDAIPNKDKEVLMKKGEFYPESTTNDQPYYSLVVDTLNNSAHIYFGYKSGNNDYSTDEIKLFQKSDKNYIVVRSQYSGILNKAVHQDTILIYEYNYITGTVIHDSNYSGVFSVHVKDFFKHSVPESELTDFTGHGGIYLSLFNNDTKDPIFILNDFQKIYTEKRNPHMRGDKIELKWKNNEFVKSPASFDE